MDLLVAAMNFYFHINNALMFKQMPFMHELEMIYFRNRLSDLP